MDQTSTIQPALVEKASRGDKEAQSLLYRQFSRAMFNICMRMTGNRNDAEDLLQNSFVKAFSNLSQLSQPGYFGGWLRRIVVNECIRHSKSSFYWNDLDEDHTGNIDGESGEWWTAISPELVHEEIKKLPEGCRQVFVLYAMEDFSHKQIADNLHISESTSKSQYQRARKLLKERIIKHIATHG